MIGVKRFILLLSMATIVAVPAFAEDHDWEYQVVILQGVLAGGTIEKQASGRFVDTKKTATLNQLAAEGWVVVSVVGAPGADHTVYLKRERNR